MVYKSTDVSPKDKSKIFGSAIGHLLCASGHGVSNSVYDAARAGDNWHQSLTNLRLNRSMLYRQANVCHVLALDFRT
jgi:hypothetical protein